MTGQQRHPAGAPGAGRPADPFDLLGLAPDDALTDDDVRIAWRRIAAATHPDRSDGGDPGRFAAAAAAYTELRTGDGRGEARAARAAPAARAGIGAGHPFRLKIFERSARPAVGARPAVRGGRPIRLVLRMLVAAAAGLAGFLAAGSDPAGPAVAVGALTWFAVTVRRDLPSR